VSFVLAAVRLKHYDGSYALDGFFAFAFGGVVLLTGLRAIAGAIRPPPPPPSRVQLAVIGLVAIGIGALDILWVVSATPGAIY
jgi:hypothetical protein